MIKEGILEKKKMSGNSGNSGNNRYIREYLYLYISIYINNLYLIFISQILLPLIFFTAVTQW